MRYSIIDMSSREEFEFWLFYMDYVLEEFLNWMPKDTSKFLDYSLNSIDYVEEFLLSRYENHSQLMSFDQRSIWDATSRYIGEVVRQTNSYKWTIDLENGDNVFYGRPIIKMQSEFCPSSIVSAFCQRQKKGYMSKTIKAYL
jgi:hypothetical protein